MILDSAHIDPNIQPYDTLKDFELIAPVFEKVPLIQ